MPIFHSFELPPDQYRQQFKNLAIPRPEWCPFCKSTHTFHRHGAYWRYVLGSNQKQQYVPVARFLCWVCRHTISILPSFVTSHFQYSVSIILTALRTRLLQKPKVPGIPAKCVGFWQRRFYQNLRHLEMFFRCRGAPDVIPQDTKEKAIKLLCMISTFPKAETFSQTFQEHCKHHFMARSFYHI